MILIIKKTHTTQNTHSPSPDTHVAILNAKIQNYTLKIALFYEITSICFHGIYFTYPTHKKIVIHRTLTSKAI